MSRSISLRKTFAATALELAERDPAVVVLVGDISHGLFSEFRQRYPERYFNVGILEPAMASLAAGLSMIGLKPIVHTIAPFLIERSFEQLKLDFSYQGLSGMFVSVGGAFDYSNLGCTHHSYIDLAMVSSLDDSKVMSPTSSVELSTLMHQSHRAWSGLAYIKLTENGVEDYDHDSQLQLGRPVSITSTKSPVCILSVGPSFVQVKQYVDGLEVEHIPNHVHVHTLKPFDYELLDQLLEGVTHVLVVEQAMSNMSFASTLATYQGWSISRKFVPLGLNGFVRNYGTYQELLGESALDALAIKAKVDEIFSVTGSN